MGRNLQIIIPMSGMGQRFLDSGYKDPKPLIEVDGYPMIKHVIDLFPSEDDFIFVCNKDHLEKTNMRKVLLDLKPNSKIVEVPHVKKGPVHATLMAFGFIDDEKETIVSYCDYGTVWDYEKFLADIKKRDLSGSIPCYTGFHPHMLGKENYAFVKEKDRFALEIKEKEPFTNNKFSEYASNGTYYFKTGGILKKYFSYLIENEISINGEYYVSLVYNKMIEDGLKVGIFEINKMLQWGTPYDLEIYKGWGEYFKNRKEEFIIPKNPDNTTLILPMSGRGSRFSQEGYRIPKPFLDVDGVPMFFKAIENLPKCNNNIFVCLEETSRFFNMEFFLKNRLEKNQIIRINKVTEGQACSCEVGIIEGKIDLESPILIKACDNGERYNPKSYQSLVDDLSVDIILWTFRNNQASKNNPEMYSWVSVDENNCANRIYCKEFPFSDPVKSHAITGTMFFRKARYLTDGLQLNRKEDKRTNGEFYVDDIINRSIESGLKVKVFEVENYICWGTPDDYKTYNYWEGHFSKIY